MLKTKAKKIGVWLLEIIAASFLFIAILNIYTNYAAGNLNYGIVDELTLFGMGIVIYTLSLRMRR